MNQLPAASAHSADDCHDQGPLVPMGPDEVQRISRILKALADPTRLQLLSMIKNSPGGEACVCALTAPLGLTQSTVSHHLKTLTEAGLISRDKRGPWAWYSIVPDRLDAVGFLLTSSPPQRPRSTIT
ncbi:helix-turn-helix transcriptional regulator [Actinomadura soli]|uniref:Helix-turn-helix transcriptional regulator n=1 Tax=Actinomadura soli TaxID=2508997 RepID=A0A5C4J5D4_9ACTN|nr:metalloregulator ArsR/SmtB family transcription factor [Actinomadura soli]TMQ92218.1 helix-turn-helix transcriptional regulator [Actinomadura soli]